VVICLNLNDRWVQEREKAKFEGLLNWDDRRRQPKTPFLEREIIKIAALNVGGLRFRVD
jgi:hypothetical protein